MKDKLIFPSLGSQPVMLKRALNSLTIFPMGVNFKIIDLEAIGKSNKFKKERILEEVSKWETKSLERTVENFPEILTKSVLNSVSSPLINYNLMILNNSVMMVSDNISKDRFTTIDDYFNEICSIIESNNIRFETIDELVNMADIAKQTPKRLELYNKYINILFEKYGTSDKK